MMERLFILLIGVVAISLLNQSSAYVHAPRVDVMVVVDNIPYKVNGKDVCKDMPLTYYADSLQPKDIRKNVCLCAEGSQQSIVLVRTTFARNGYLMINQLIYQQLKEARAENQLHSYLYYINGVLVTEDNIQNLISLRRCQIKDIAIERDDQTNNVVVMISIRTSALWQ